MGEQFVLFQFKNGRISLAPVRELEGLRVARAWDRSLGTMVTYQL